LVFRVGNALYACDIEMVREIVRIGRLTRIPGAPPFVRGLLNVRGDVLAVLDVGLRLRSNDTPSPPSLPEPPPRTESVIVVAVGERRAGLAVEEVIGVRPVAPDPPPATTAADPADIVRPMGHLDGRIVLYLDVPAFVNQSLV
jgi:purine-binding chemotaxis protein CheW